MREDDSIDAPPDALDLAKGIFRTRSLEPRLSVLRRVVAAMSIELAPNKAAFGERSGSSGQARQMLFDAGSSAVDLRITKSGRTFSIRGQVLGGEFAGATAILTSDDVQVTANVDDLSGFRFETVASGEYSLTIRTASDEIVIEGLIVK